MQALPWLHPERVAKLLSALEHRRVGLGLLDPVLQRDPSLLGHAALVEQGKDFELGSSILTGAH